MGFKEIQGEYRLVADKQVDYLVSTLTGSGTGSGTWVGEGVKTSEALQNGAVEDILQGLGEDALPYLEDKINQFPEGSGQAKALYKVMKNIKAVKSSREDQR